MRVIAVASATIGILLGGCVHEPLTRPLTAGDVERINDAATSNHWFRVEYVEPIATEEEMHVPRPVGIASADAGKIGIRTWTGAVEIVPIELVKGVTVKERARGLAGGAAIGLGAGALVVGALALLAYAVSGDGFPDSGGGGGQSPSDGSVANAVAFFVGVPTVVGGIVGFFVGGRRTFDFEHAR